MKTTMSVWAKICSKISYNKNREDCENYSVELNNYLEDFEATMVHVQERTKRSKGIISRILKSITSFFGEDDM